MKDPRAALDEARVRSAAGRERGEYRQLDRGPDLAPPTRIVDTRLTEWALIEPDRTEIYSTRRFGKPITLLKRLLVRFLRQYLDQVTAQQSRFNAQVAAHIMNLDDRVREVEAASKGRKLG